MEDNAIILIDSSDDEGSPCKIRKVDDKKSSIDTQKISSEDIRTSEAINDVVVIDEDEPVLTIYKNEILVNTIPQIDNDTIVKRIELTTLKDKPTLNIECTNLPIHETSEETNIKLNIQNNIEKISSPDAEKIQKAPSEEFEDFLEACMECDCDIKYKNMILKKIPNIKSKYIDADESSVECHEFKKYLINKTEKVKKKSANAIIIFNEVYRDLESKRRKSFILTQREKYHLKKLYKTLEKINKKIKALEIRTVDFEEDNNSSYIMLERYKERFCSVQKKICSFTKENFYSGRYLFRTLNFSSSKYSEINRSIDILYNKKKQFPSYYEVDNCIRKCAQKNNLNLTEDILNKEIRTVFTAVGNVLQRRRKRELFESLTYFLDGTEDDPADRDPEFEALLRRRHVENEQKIDDVLQKYADCEEVCEEPSLSTDSDDSHHISDEN